MILTIREKRVMLTADLADVYGVETRALTQAVKRNEDRFPSDFAFQLSAGEFAELKSRGTVTSDGRVALRSQTVILKRGQHAKYPPFAFTEHGAIMAATVLNSKEAVSISVYVVRAFMQMREQLSANLEILKRLAEIDKTLLQHDAGLRDIYRKLLPLLQPAPDPPRRRIGFGHDEK
jgi:ORF6N domain